MFLLPLVDAKKRMARDGLDNRRLDVWKGQGDHMANDLHRQNDARTFRWNEQPGRERRNEGFLGLPASMAMFVENHRGNHNDPDVGTRHLCSMEWDSLSKLDFLQPNFCLLDS